MMIELPDAEVAGLGLTSEQARVELAAGLYAGRQVTLGRAARIAGLSQTAFLHELGKHGICVNFTEDDAQQDIARVRERLGK
jgi:predicted HTH domain antitoxin